MYLLQNLFHFVLNLEFSALTKPMSMIKCQGENCKDNFFNGFHQFHSSASWKRRHSYQIMAIHDLFQNMSWNGNASCVHLTVLLHFSCFASTYLAISRACCPDHRNNLYWKVTVTLTTQCTFQDKAFVFKQIQITI